MLDFDSRGGRSGFSPRDPVEGPQSVTAVEDSGASTYTSLIVGQAAFPAAFVGSRRRFPLCRLFPRCLPPTNRMLVGRCINFDPWTLMLAA